MIARRVEGEARFERRRRARRVAERTARGAHAAVRLCPRRPQRDGALSVGQRTVRAAEEETRRAAIRIERRIVRRQHERLAPLSLRLAVTAFAEGGGRRRLQRLDARHRLRGRRRGGGGGRRLVLGVEVDVRRVERERRVKCRRRARRVADGAARGADAAVRLGPARPQRHRALSVGECAVRAAEQEARRAAIRVERRIVGRQHERLRPQPRRVGRPRRAERLDRLRRQLLGGARLGGRPHDEPLVVVRWRRRGRGGRRRRRQLQQSRLQRAVLVRLPESERAQPLGERGAVGLAREPPQRAAVAAARAQLAERRRLLLLAPLVEGGAQAAAEHRRRRVVGGRRRRRGRRLRRRVLQQRVARAAAAAELGVAELAQPRRELRAARERQLGELREQLRVERAPPSRRGKFVRSSADVGARTQPRLSVNRQQLLRVAMASSSRSTSRSPRTTPRSASTRRTFPRSSSRRISGCSRSSGTPTATAGARRRRPSGSRRCRRRRGPGGQQAAARVRPLASRGADRGRRRGRERAEAASHAAGQRRANAAARANRRAARCRRGHGARRGLQHGTAAAGRRGDGAAAGASKGHQRPVVCGDGRPRAHREALAAAGVDAGGCTEKGELAALLARTREAEAADAEVKRRRRRRRRR